MSLPLTHQYKFVGNSYNDNMCGFDSDFFPECKSKSISGGFIHQAGIFGVKCFSIFCGLILADFKSGEILMPND